MKSQFASTARVTVDPLGDKAIKELSDHYAKQDIEEFLEYCQSVINSAVGKKEKKLVFCRIIAQSRTKEFALQKTMNYILAGMGLAV